MKFDDLGIFRVGVFDTLDYPTLLGWPANLHHDTGVFQSLGIRVLQKQAAALYLAGTGDDLDADASITTGHKHNAWSSLLRWRQLGSWRPQGGKDDDVKEGYQTSTAINPLWGSILVPLDSAGTGLPEVRIVPRYRVSYPAPGTSTPGTLTIKGTLYRNNSGSLTSVATVPPVVAVSTSEVSFTHAWIEGAGVDLPVTDTVTAGGLLFWKTEFEISAGTAAIYEGQIGWLEG